MRPPVTYSGFDPLFFIEPAAGADRGTGGRISAEVYRQSLTLLVKKNRGKPDSKGKPEQQDNAAV